MTDEFKDNLKKFFEDEAEKRRDGGSFDQLIEDMTKFLYVYRMATGDSKSAITRRKNVSTDIKSCIRRWVQLNSVCEYGEKHD